MQKWQHRRLLPSNYKQGLHAPGERCARLAQVIRNSAAFPSPVIALGSQHTINDAIVAENGTVLQLAGWTAIYGLEERQVHACGTAPHDCTQHDIRCFTVASVKYGL